MDRIYEANVSLTAPAAGGVSGFPSDGDPVGGMPPTTPGARWFHQITEELRNLVLASGETPDGTQVNQVAGAVVAIAAAVQTAAAADATSKANAARSGAVSDVNSEFTGANQGTNFQKFPGGLILQWAVATVDGPGSTVVTWPFAFPTSLKGVLVSPNGAFMPSTQVSVIAQSTSGCTVDCYSNTDTPTVIIFAFGK